MSGIGRFAKILAPLWVLSWLTVDGSSNDAVSPPAAAILVWFEALPTALIVGVMAWLAIRGKPPAGFNLLTPAFCWGVIAIGALKWGGVYGKLKAAGLDGGEAGSQALLGPQGIIIGLGILGLIYSKNRKAREINAQN